MPPQATYVPADLATTTLFQVRFWMGDTNVAKALFCDSEITFVLTTTTNVKLAAAEMLEAKANNFAQKADITVGGVSKKFSQISKSMRVAAGDLRRDVNRRALPFFGGLTKSGKRDLAQRTDDVQPAISRGITDNPFAVQLNDQIDELRALVGNVL